MCRENEAFVPIDSEMLLQLMVNLYLLQIFKGQFQAKFSFIHHFSRSQLAQSILCLPLSIFPKKTRAAPTGKISSDI